VIKEPGVGEESSWEEDVSEQAGHLLFETLARSLPSDALRTKILDELLASFDFILHLIHFVLDVLDFTNEHSVVNLVLLNVVFKLLDKGVEFNHLSLHGL